MKYSASGIGILQSCERQFFYRYYMKQLVGNPGKDCDSPSPKGMIQGRLFHAAWEEWVKNNDVSLDYLQNLCEKELHESVNKATRVKTIKHVLNPHETPAIVKAMCAEYAAFLKDLKKEQGFEELCLELGFETDLMRGYIDAIIYDKTTKKWAIQDKKTRILSEDGLANIKKTPQFLIYVAHLRELIELVYQRTKVKLDEKNFCGVYVCEITRPIKARKKARGKDKENTSTTPAKTEFYETVERIEYVETCYTETMDDFYERLLEEKAVKIRQAHVVVSREEVSSFWKEQVSPMIRKAEKMRLSFDKNKTAQGVMNTDNCINRYGAACEYWSQCHDGKTKSECVADIQETYFTRNVE